MADWTLRAKCAIGESHCQLQALSKNWKEAKENKSTDFLSVSELLSQRTLCNVNISACISKIALMSSPTSQLKANFLVIDKHSLKEHNDFVRDFITAGCKLCGSPIHHRNLHGENNFALDCPYNPKYLHVPGQIYRPFLVRLPML